MHHDKFETLIFFFALYDVVILLLSFDFLIFFKFSKINQDAPYIIDSIFIIKELQREFHLLCGQI